MASLTLVVMAAGIGSRYGGLKQIDPVGPSGEIVIDYSVFDALRAGFDKVVFVIRREIEDAFREGSAGPIETRVETAYVLQELDRLPAGFSLPAGRTKPWGTAHAILCARDSVATPVRRHQCRRFLRSGQPSRALAGHLRRAADSGGDLRLRHGRLHPRKHPFRARSRGPRRLSRSGPDRCLVDIRERERIRRFPDGVKFAGKAGSGSGSRPEASSR